MVQYRYRGPESLTRRREVVEVVAESGGVIKRLTRTKEMRTRDF